MTLRGSHQVTYMSKIIDQTYLLHDQYKDATNLDARIRLHLLFSTNKYGWQQWCFDHYALPAEARVLEIGCGPAHLWATNIDRVPPGWRITLLDFSDGMLEQARQNLGFGSQASTALHSAQHAAQFVFEIADAQQIPFGSESFDAVIANHMLYHVPDRARALAEMQRVLQPGGTIYLATNGLSHLRELYKLEERFDPTIDFGWSQRAHDLFSLDKGGAEIERFFQDVRVVRYADALNITQAAPLVDYILSMTTTPAVQQRRAELQRFIEQELNRAGVIHITKESGMFIGGKA
jgi:ubiquinone/menaquinone biosynthesis C-methylase UbiE